MSNVVDSKVVELQFENKDFEKNATQSISTLNELKESLNFTGSTKGLEEINSNIKAVNFSNLTNGIKEATNGFSVMETIAFGVFNRLGARIADFAVNSIGKLFTAIPSQIWSGGKRRSFNMEQAKFQIEGLEKEWEDIKDDIDYSVAGTAYGMDVAAKAASQLIASGVEFGNTFGETGNSPMAKALRGISGVAAMTGSSYEEISRIFTTVAGQGRAMAGELNRIAERGLNGSKAIADFMNNEGDRLSKASESVQKEVQEITGGMKVTEADIRELASKGAISFAIFSEAMDSAFGEHATKANETFAGTVSNIKAQLSKLGEVFVSPAMEAAVPFLNNVYNIIKNLRTLIAGTSDKPTAFMKGYLAMIHGITGGLELITGAIKAFTAGENFDFIGTIKKAFGFGEVEEVADETAAKVAGSFETIRDTAFKVIKGDFGTGMDRINKLTEEGFDADTVQDYVNALWEVSGHDWSKIFDEGIQKQAADMINLGKSTEKCAENGQDLADQQRDEQKALRAMSKEMTKSERVMFGLINIFTGLSGAFDAVKKAFAEKVKMPSFGGILDTITTNFLLLSDSFNKFVSEHADDIAAVFTGIANAVLLAVDVFRTLLKIVLAVATVAILPLVAIIGGLTLLIFKAVTAIRNWATENQIFQKITDKINNTLTTAKSKIEGWWKAFKEFPAVKKAIDKFKTAFSNAFTKAPYYLQQTKNAVVRFGTRAKNAFKQLWSKKISPAEFFDQMKLAWSNFTKTVSSFQFVQEIKAAIGSAKSALDEWFTSLGTNEDGTLNTFGKLYEHIKNIGSVLGSAWGSAKQFVANLDPIGFISEKISAVSDKFTQLKESFLNFPGMAENLEKFKEGFKSAFENIPTFIGGAITHLGGFFRQVGSGFMKLIHGEYTPEQFMNSVKLAFDNVLRYFTEFHGFDTFKESVKGMVEAVGGWIDSLGTNADGSRNAFGKFLDKAKEVRDWILEKWETAKEKIQEFFGGLGLDPEGLLNKFNILKQGIKTFIEGIPEWFSGLKGAFGDFFERIKNLGDNDALSFENILFVFGDTVGKYFKEHDVFAPIKAAFKLLFEDLKTSAKESFPEVFETWENIKAFFKDFSIPKALSLLPKIFGSLWKILKNNFKKKIQDIGDGIGDIGTFITDHLKDLFKLDTSKIVGVLVGVLVLKKIMAALTAFNESRAKTGSFGDNMLKFAAAIAVLAIVMAALSKLDGPTFLRSLLMVTVIGGALLAAMFALAAISKFAGGGATLMGATGAMLELVAAIGVLALIMAALTKFKWEDFLQSLGKIVLIAGALLLAMLALSAIGPVGMVGATAALELAASIAMIVWALNTAATTDMEAAGRNLAKGFKAFCEEIEGIEVSPEALAAIQAVSDALKGPMWNGFWGAIGEFATNVLPGTGEDQTLMERFQASATTLADTVTMWSDTLADIKPNYGANTAINLIKTAVNKCNSSGMWGAIGDFVGNVFADDSHEGMTSMERFKSAAKTLSDTVNDWQTSMNGITVDQSVLNGVLDLKDVLDQVSASGLNVAIDSFWGNWLSTSGEDKTSVDRFSEGVGAMAGSLRVWNDGMNGKDGEGPVGEIVEPPIEGIRSLAAALDEIPSMGLADHIANFIAGGYPSTKDVEKFEEHLTALASAINAWNTGMTVDGKPVTVTNVDTEAIKNLAEGLKEIPSDSIFSNLGDLLTGSNKEDEAERFKTNLEVLGQAIAGYVTALAGTNEEDIAKATKILRAMGDFANAVRLMDFGGEGSNLNGASDLFNFAGEIDSVLLPCFDHLVTKITDLEGFETVIEGLKSLATLSEVSLTEGDIADTTAVDNFSAHIDTIVTAMNKAAISAFMTSAGINKLKENAETLASTDLNSSSEDVKSDAKSTAEDAAKGIGEAKDAFNSEMGKALSGAMGAISRSKADYKSAGSSLMMALAAGMKKASGTVANNAGKAAKAGVEKARGYYSKFRGAGGYMSEGFSQGITNMIFKVRIAAEAMAKAALEKARHVLKVGSPSKEAAEIGMFFDLGFAGGVSKYTTVVEDATHTMADKARKGLAKAARTINDMIDSGLDTNPVVRPVLDLSEIQNGAASIGSMLNTAPPLALAGNLGAISNSFTNRTDPNSEILTALGSLKDSLDSSPRNTYNINGMTYDDGSNISSAVETLIHAALVERRV